MGCVPPLATGLTLATAAPAYAADPPPPQIFDAGVACDFALRVDQSLAERRLSKTFLDENGNPVKILSVGKGPDTKLTNLDNGRTLTLRGNGSGSITTVNADGTFTIRQFGHSILILFPTDVPAGPTTTLIAGTAVFASDADFNFTVQKITGRTTDLCDALA